jgi:hypothetical protein
VRGYNPEHRGRASFHPLLAFEARSRLWLQGTWRRGDRSPIGPPGEAEALVDAALQALPEGTSKIFVRGDAGFFAERFFKHLEARGIGYVVSARGKVPKTLDFAALRYEEDGRGVAYAEWTGHHHGWEKDRRFLIVRRRYEVPSGPRQGTLFPEPEFEFTAFVTNRKTSIRSLVRFYNHRAEIEQRIAELRSDMGLGAVAGTQFAVNWINFLVTQHAYNLLHALKLLAFPPRYHRHEAATIRRLFLHLPARILRHGRRLLLRFQKGLTIAHDWTRAIGRLQPGTS